MSHPNPNLEHLNPPLASPLPVGGQASVHLWASFNDVGITFNLEIKTKIVFNKERIADKEGTQKNIFTCKFIISSCN